MVVETSFPIGEPSAWRKIKSLEGFTPGQPVGLNSWPAKLREEISLPEWYALGRYTCDGVSLRQEVVSRGREWEEPGLRIHELRTVPSGIEVTIEATLYNPRANHDKLVTLAFEILAEDERVIATSSKTQKASDNSKSGNNADVMFLFSTAEVKQAVRLRLTVSTKDY